MKYRASKMKAMKGKPAKSGAIKSPQTPVRGAK